jgi:hypothetical protein
LSLEKFAFFCIFFLRLNATSEIFNLKFHQNDIFFWPFLESFQKPKFAFFMQRSRFCEEKEANLRFFCVYLRLFVFFLRRFF